MLVEPVSLSGKNLNSLSQQNNTSRNQEVQIENKNKYEEEQQQTAISSDADEIFADLQNKMKILHNIDLSFSVHESSGKILITVIDEDTGEVIREIPSSEMLNLSAKLQEAIGLILDEKV